MGLLGKIAPRLVSILIAVILVGGCQWLIDPATEHNGPQVAVVGDSITILASNRITADVSPTHALIANAVFGATIQDQLPWLQSHLADSPIVVENLGTNNINHAGWETEETALLDAVASQPCVELVTIQHGSPNDAVTAFNAALVQATVTNPDLHIVDWAAAVAADPSLVFDGVHPSDSGTAWLGRHIADAIANDCVGVVS